MKDRIPSPRWLTLGVLLVLFWQCRPEKVGETESAPEAIVVDTILPTQKPTPPTTRSPTTLSEEELAFQQLVTKKESLARANKQLGFVFVPFPAKGITLLFYAGPAPDAKLVDSLVYTSEEHRLNLVHAPADYQPFYFKEDFQLLILRMTDIAGRRAEVEINEESGRTAWIDGTAVVAQDWKTFLENVAFVEPVDWSANPPRKAPEAAAPRVAEINEQVFLQPQKVQGDWLQVKSFSEQADAPSQIAWIRWRQGEKVLVSWDYVL